jgi:hypothetical protein
LPINDSISFIIKAFLLAIFRVSHALFAGLLSHFLQTFLFSALVTLGSPFETGLLLSQLSQLKDFQSFFAAISKQL